MGRLAPALRNAKVRLGKSASDARKLRGRMKPDQLRDSRAFLLAASRRLPLPGDIGDLLEMVRARWDPPESGNASGTAQSGDDGRAKNQILREVLPALRRTRKLAAQLLVECDRDSALTMMSDPAAALLRAQLPRERSTMEQMVEILSLMGLFAELIGHYARRLKA